ncbi:hypothetical protein LKV13_03685 [Borrelia sp. BU AG58]|uniref:hypothetical protein n=1 Tax=Borrelia sp. BU AG58 TaxID=2887345 RepID=UPI001E34576E|nr:hypothetical protein [Borrelia sp. BU AG58]UER67867.1 hypothetical protein LKV13_03685 [Borrelia sp. BU AG58]
MKIKILLVLLLIVFYSYAQEKQILTEITPLSISSKSGKGSVYLRVGKSSNYILTFNNSLKSDFVYMIYDVAKKSYITDKVKKRDIRIKLEKDVLYAVIYITSENSDIDFYLTDLDLSIISDNSLKANPSNIKTQDKTFLLREFPIFKLDSKIKRYILRIHKNNIYIAYQMETGDNIKISAFIENIGWFDINSAVNENITGVACFDFAINSGGELYVAFTTRGTNNFSRELIVKKFNSRKWIDISPRFKDNIGFLVNISIDRRDNLYLAYLREVGKEYKVNFITNEGYGRIWNNADGAYVSKGNSDVDVANIGIISEPFLGIFYNYQIDGHMKSEFVIDKGKSWANTNTQSAIEANFIKILSNVDSNQVVLSYVTKGRPIVSVSTLKFDKWHNISPNIKVKDGISSDIIEYRNNLFLVYEDDSDVRLIYFDDNNWYFVNGAEIFQKSAVRPQIEHYGREGFILSYLSSDLKTLYLKLIT